MELIDRIHILLKQADYNECKSIILITPPEATMKVFHVDFNPEFEMSMGMFVTYSEEEDKFDLFRWDGILIEKF